MFYSAYIGHLNTIKISSFSTVPPVIVDLYIIQSQSGPVALPNNPSADLETDTVNQYVLKFLHGKTYTFRATTNEIYPGADFDWSRTDDVNTPGGTMIKDGVLPPQNNECFKEHDTAILTIENLDYDTWRNRKLRVDASNPFSPVSAWEHVVFDVDGNCNILGQL